MIQSGECRELEKLFREKGARSILLVCGGSFRKQELYGKILEAAKAAGAGLTEFSDFEPNPKYESVVKGVDVFLRESCDFIIAAGGGSAMDVAKCIKLFWNMDRNENYLKQEAVKNTTPILAISTTAGTGSEATRFAVIYYEGNKQSVHHDSILPEYVVLDPKLLDSLPEYQRKSTMLDALCHALESYWSVNATEESQTYAAEAIRQVFRHMDAYLNNEPVGNEGMLRASNTAGKAINFTQTTAGHAMCYKLTTLYGLAHGHAAALCVKVLWPYMAEHTADCTDPRGEAYFQNMLEKLAQVMGCADVEASIQKYNDMLEKLSLRVPVMTHKSELDLLKGSVNPDRLKNHPVLLTEETLENLYRQIFRKG